MTCPFDCAQTLLFRAGIKARSGSTLSKPQHLCWGAEGLTSYEEYGRLKATI
jgi:hypothetical protein